MLTKKYAIIGAKGYLGKHLSHMLKQMGADVYLYDHIGGPNIKPLDITDKQALDNIDWAVDYVFHFAGLTGTYASFDNYEQFIKINELGLINVLNAIKKTHYRPLLVFPSSRLVYRGSDLPLRENDVKQANTVYAANKIACEHFLEAYQKAYNINYIIFRICVPYANLLDSSYSYGTIGFFISQAKKNGIIKLYGDGSLRRTFSHVEDACRQIIQTLGCTNSVNNVFNVGGEEFSLLEIARIIAEKFDATIEFIAWPEIDHLIESGHTVFDSAKIDTFARINRKHCIKDWISSLAADEKQLPETSVEGNHCHLQ